MISTLFTNQEQSISLIRSMKTNSQVPMYPLFSCTKRTDYKGPYTKSHYKETELIKQTAGQSTWVAEELPERNHWW